MKTRLIHFALMSVSLGLGGCAESAGGNNTDNTIGSATTQQGLSIETAQEGLLRGSFSQDGITVRFEAIRGERNPNADTDLDSPEYAVDARFYTTDGSSLLMSGGGHGFDDETWDDREGKYDPELRTEALRLIPELLNALGNSELSDLVAPEQERLVALGTSIADVELEHAPEGNVPYACTTGFVHQMFVRNKAAFDTTYGNHTAIYVDSWFLGSSCTYLYVGRKESCNHGTCASDAAMATACSWQSALRSYQYPAFQVYSAYSNGACTTYYSPWSTLGGHNCNDDAYFQIWNIRNDTYYPAATGPNNICTDSIGHAWSPTCSGVRGAP